MTYRLRPATLHDMPALSQLSHVAFSAGFKGFYDQALIDDILPFITSVSEPLVRSGHLHLAQSSPGGEIVGVGGWSVDFHGQPGLPGEGHIRHFAVHPGWGRQGIGQALMRRCLDEAADITLFHCQSSRCAVPFYASMGFEMVRDDEVTMPNGVRFPTVLMQLKSTL